MKKYDELVARYIRKMHTNELSENSIATYKQTFRLFREFMESHGYDEPTPAAVLDFKDDGDRSITTRAMYMNHLRLLSRFGEALGHVPFYTDEADTPRKKLSQARLKPYEHVLTEQDMIALITAERPVYGRKTSTWLREQAEVALMIQSGLRNLELRTLRPRDLDWENGVIIPCQTKGDKVRAVAFPSAAQKAVKRYLESGLRPADVSDNEPLFGTVGPDGKWHGMERHKLSDRVYTFTKSVLGEEKACRTHAARHCYASVLLEHGVDMQYISETMGHSSVATTKIYAARFSVNAPAASVASVFDSVTA